MPDLTVSAGALRNNPENSISALIGFSLDLPLFNRNASSRKQTRFQAQAVTDRKENTLQILRADIRDFYNRIIEIDRKLSVMESGLIPKTHLAYQLIQDYYQAGSAAFLDLASAQTEILRLHINKLDIEMERAGVMADIMQMTSFPVNIVR